MVTTGNVEGLSLADLLQVSSLGRRTCHLRVSDGSESGDIYLEDGRAVHATFGALRGEPAVLAMLASPAVYVRLDSTRPPQRRTLDRDPQELVLEAARLSDEAARVRVSPSSFAGIPVEAPRSRGQRAAWGLLALAAVGLVGLAVLLAWRLQRGGNTAGAAETQAPPLEVSQLVGPGDEPPRLVEWVAPVRPQVDLALTPTIVCRLLVDREGRVAERRIYRSRLDLAAFEDAALDATTRFRFRPARHAGAEVAAWINVPVRFEAAGARATEAVRIKGSDTINGVLGPALARAWEARRPGGKVTVEALGSTTAFVGLLDGSADIGASSRPAAAKEIEQAHALGVTLEEHLLGYDGVAVIVNPKNPVQALTLGQLAHLFGSADAVWSAGRPVHAIGRPSYSGTHTFFKERALPGGDFARSVRELERNEDIVAAVARDPDAIAYVGLGWVSGEVRAVALAPGDGRAAVEPSPATVHDGTYPLYRSLLLYTRGAPHGEISRFLQFALSSEGQALVAKNGFVQSDAAAPMAEMTSEEETAGAAPAPVRVLFRPAQVTLDDDSRRALRALATLLGHEHQRALVVGHADADGDSAANRRLARARAERVAAYLVAVGAPPEAVRIDDASADRPVASNATPEGRRLNRRADIYLMMR